MLWYCGHTTLAYAGYFGVYSGIAVTLLWRTLVILVYAVVLRSHYSGVRWLFWCLQWYCGHTTLAYAGHFGVCCGIAVTLLWRTLVILVFTVVLRSHYSGVRWSFWCMLWYCGHTTLAYAGYFGV